MLFTDVIRDKRDGGVLTDDEIQFFVDGLADESIPAEAKTGTLVIFDGRAPHLSGPNLSDNSRHAYTLHVIDKKSYYPAENWLQRSADLPFRGFAD